MRFTVSSGELVSRLQTMGKIISEKVSIPIMSNILFSVRGNSLILTAANSENRMTTTLDIQNEEGQDGDICIPSAKLTDYIRHLPEQPILFVINTETYELAINSQSAVSRQVCVGAEEYPEDKGLEGDVKSFSITEDALLSGISSTVFATANDTIRAFMNCIYIDIEQGGTVSFVATDSHKMARYMSSNVETGDLVCGILLNKKPAMLLRSILSKTTDEVKVSFDSRSIMFETNMYRYVTRLSEGNFPAYKSIIPNNNDFRLTINRQDMLSALMRVSVFVDGTHLVKCELFSNSLQMIAQDTDYSYSAQETIACEYNGPELTIGFSGKYLTESLSNIESADVTFELSDPSRPGMIRPLTQEENTDMLVMIMPMNVQ